MKKVLISLTEEQFQRLEELAEQLGMSKSEAIRSAMKTYAIFRAAQERGDEWRRRTATGEEIVLEFVN